MFEIRSLRFTRDNKSLLYPDLTVFIIANQSHRTLLEMSFMSVTSLLQRAAINHLMMLGAGGPPLGYILKLAAVRRGIPPTLIHTRSSGYH